jgi:hypothetical protein
VPFIVITVTAVEVIGNRHATFAIHALKRVVALSPVHAVGVGSADKKIIAGDRKGVRSRFHFPNT